jgi:CPA2 family monovalent cation:H+ antiporter-2
VITLLLGFLFPRPAFTALVIAVGLSQIGEFSFILGEAGLSLGMLDQDQVSLILAGALLSISINPLMFKLLGPLEAWLQRIPAVWERINRHAPPHDPRGEELTNHVVIIGAGRMGGRLAGVLETLHIPHLVIESNVDQVEELNRHRTITLFGDAANSEVITHAHLERAQALVITVPDESTSSMIAASARQLNPTLSIIARAATQEAGYHLARLGVQHIVLPEVEGGLELVHYTLSVLGFPLREIHETLDAVRLDLYSQTLNPDEEHRSLHQLISAFDYIEIFWSNLPERSPLIGQTLSGADIRSRTGASVVALIRNNRLIPNPKSRTIFEEGDRIGIIGEEDQIQAAKALFSQVDILDW